jgi:CDP-4-dehydro-6-deoxyglucose reductase
VVSVITLSNGKQFNAQDGETVLDAALRGGVVLEHSCRTGRCGSCKGHLQSGDTAPVHEQTGLSPQEQADGWILTCARTPTTDLTLEVDDLGGLQLYPAKTVPCRIQQLEALSADVVKVTLRLPPNQALSYHAGQYVDVIGFNGLRRSYSIANVTSAANPHIELHIKKVDGGAMSAYWFDTAKPNDLLRLHGPQGTFFLRDVAGLDLVLLATGTGMAPIKAILESLRTAPADAQPRSVHVYWGGRHPEDLYWDPLSLGSAIQFTPVLSRAGDNWGGARGHVQQACLAAGHDLSRTVVYACGSDKMIDSARTALVAAGLPLRSFHSDAFVCSS